jgi:hypothetical protein
MDEDKEGLTCGVHASVTEGEGKGEAALRVHASETARERGGRADQLGRQGSWAGPAAKQRKRNAAWFTSLAICKIKE